MTENSKEKKKLFHMPDKPGKRIPMCVLGVIGSGVSVGLFKLAAFGIDPFQTFMTGLDSVIPISFGTLYVIANVVLLLFALIFDRHYIGLGTIVNLFLVGYVVQYSYKFFCFLFPSVNLVGRIISLLIAVVVMCFASSFYFTADLGVSTYDAVSLIIVNTFHKGKFRFVRIMTDFTCVALGALLYYLGNKGFDGIFQTIGIGTIITAFFMGPLVDFFNRKVAGPFLNGRSKEENNQETSNEK